MKYGEITFHAPQPFSQRLWHGWVGVGQSWFGLWGWWVGVGRAWFVHEGFGVGG